MSRKRPQPKPEDAARLDGAISDLDRRRFAEITSARLTEAQRLAIVQPPRVHRDETAVLGIHWHPEFVPIELVMQRLDRAFPNRTCELVIPTQHNQIMANGELAGVEVDCYSPEFKRKIQLLLHFRADRLQGADRLRSMIAHTFRYRGSQLFEFIDTLLDPKFEMRLQRAARETSARESLIHFVRVQASKLKQLMAENEGSTPPDMVKNKLLRHWFDRLRGGFGNAVVDRAQFFLRAVKAIVKADFDSQFFYDTRQMIEEARLHGAGVVVPHPEQFWPVLLADYDIDGYEVWNPQSMDYTEFLIEVLDRLNQTGARRSRPILLAMGDDCHMGEKLIPKELQDPEKAGREVGYQPAWEHLDIRKKLILHNVSKRSVIEEYRSRLG